MENTIFRQCLYFINTNNELKKGELKVGISPFYYPMEKI